MNGEISPGKPRDIIICDRSGPMSRVDSDAENFLMPEQSYSNQIDAELLSLLRCPLTHSALRQEGDFLIAKVGGLAYPVRDGIPVMLAEEARLPDDVRTLEEFKAKMATENR